MSVVSKKRIVTAAYEHVKGIYSGCLENPEVSDSKNIFGIPSVMDNIILSLRPGTQDLVAHDGFNIYACQMSHTSKGGL